MLWRRSYDTPPPPIEAGSEFAQAGDPRYAGIGERAAHRVPQGRRRPVAAVLGRARSLPDLRAGQTVLVAAHGNSLRALVKHLDGICDEDIAGLNIPTGMPAASTTSTTTSCRPRAGGSTSTPRPRPRPPRRSPTRAAEPGPLARHQQRGYAGRGRPRGIPTSHGPPSAPAAIRPAAGRTGRPRSAGRPGRSPATGPRRRRPRPSSAA